MMSAPNGITVIILTFNEEKHLLRCIQSLLPVAERICVVDSFSTDGTIEIARGMGAEVYQNEFVNHAQQFDWATRNINVQSGWILRIDADEYLDSQLQESIVNLLRNPSDLNAIYLRRKIVFLGRPIKHGFFYPLLILRLYRTGQGRMERRWMDEHIVVDQPISKTLDGDLVDENLNSLAWWTAKHVNYARREAYEIVASRELKRNRSSIELSGRARWKRWLKEVVYGRLPSGLRSGMYFLYRYVLGAGFLDGKPGFYFHFLQAYWYRTYVDATLYELERSAAAQGISAYEMLRREGIL